MPYNVNQFGKFQHLITGSHTEVITITANNGDGTSTGDTPSGVSITIRGESVAPPNKAFVKDGVVVDSAPNLTVVQVSI